MLKRPGREHPNNMSRVMLVNVTHVEESRVAILDQGVLDSYEIETINRTLIKGNIHNAVVENVHPSLEAAFIKISPEMNGFLPLDEVNFNLLPARGEKGKAGRIGQHLHPGQRLMAQVVREPFSGKPPTVSTYFSLPGRYLVLMPGVDTAGVSRKIEDPKQRDRLKKIANELRPPEGFGVIVRTAGLGQTKLELQRDLRYLLRLWQSIQRASQAAEFPALVYREADLVIRTIRDHLSADISEVWIDSKETYDKALEFVKDVMPGRAKTLRLYTGDRPLFNKFNLEDQIESIYKRRVPLPSGGEIVIDGTEALTAIDVNSARSRRKGEAEDNAVKTNLEAAVEIARQLRLRDLGGLIVIDFIDMMAAKNRKKVEEAARAALRGDRARYDMTRLSKMGLMEIARQRLKAAKMSAMYTACPSCEGYGLIKNLEAAALAALRKLQARSTRTDIGRIRLAVPPDVATWMLNNKRDDLVSIERRHNLRIDIEPRGRMLRHETELEVFPRELPVEPAPRDESTRAAPPPQTGAEEAEAQPAEAAPAEAGEPAETASPKKKPAESTERRKRRRRKRKTDKPVDQAAQEPKVVEFKPADAGESAAHEPPADGDAESAEAPPKRRRRRRRRPRTSASSTSSAPDSNGASGRPEQGPDRIVPQGVRADELMPAAVGGAAKRAKRTSRSSSGRRRKGTAK
jgi:ribonuclease E